MYRPVLNFTVAGQLYRGWPWRVRVFQQEGGFEAAVIDLPAMQADTVRFAKGTPVQLTWGRSLANLSAFPGYVAYVDIDRTRERARDRLVCIGAGGMALRDAASRVWPVGSSCDAAVRAIGDALHLSTTTESTSLSAPGGPVHESWANYLRRTARAAGFTFAVSGTDMVFHSRRIDASDSPKPYFWAQLAATMRTNRRVFEWNVLDDTDTGSETHRRRSGYGLTDEGLLVQFTDSGDLESVGGTGQELPSLLSHEDLVVHDMGSAAGQLRALQESNRFARSGHFLLSGDERVNQSGTVVIRGIRDDLDGYWYVKSVVHDIRSASYSMKVAAGRDGVGDSAPTDPTGVDTVVVLGQSQPVPAPRPVLVSQQQSARDLVMPSRTARWRAASVKHRLYIPWKAAVRG